MTPLLDSETEEWRSAKSWPPVSGSKRLFAAPGRQLTDARPNVGASDMVTADFTAGSGTQTLSGSNTYTGTTTVQGGELLVDGVIGTNSVTVSGGILAGTAWGRA